MISELPVIFERDKNKIQKRRKGITDFSSATYIIKAPMKKER